MIGLPPWRRYVIKTKVNSHDRNNDMCSTISIRCHVQMRVSEQIEHIYGNTWWENFVPIKYWFLNGIQNKWSKILPVIVREEMSCDNN